MSCSGIRGLPYLKIKTVKGVEYYVARIQKDGKVREKSLGAVAKVKPAEVKAKLRAFIDAVEGDTLAAGRATFADLWAQAVDDIDGVKRWKSPKTRESWTLSLGTYACEAFGSKPVASITRDDVLNLLKPLWRTKTATAAKLRLRLEMFFDWAEAHGHRSGKNPAAWAGNLELFLPARSKVRVEVHHEAPTIEELRAAVAYCRAHPSPASGLILFLIATVARLSEARLAKPDEIKKDVWEMPPERRKDGKTTPHRVPLSSIAREALTMANREGYLFSVTGAKPLSLDTARLKLCMILKRKVTAHGIRSTFRDWAAVTGKDFIASEKALMHSVGSAVTQAYLRSDMLDVRREIMQEWAAVLTERRSL